METQGKTLPWSFEQDFETESGLKAGILGKNNFQIIFGSGLWSIGQRLLLLCFFGKVT